MASIQGFSRSMQMLSSDPMPARDVEAVIDVILFAGSAFFSEMLSMAMLMTEGHDSFCT
jgi:hypothetical protein